MQDCPLVLIRWHDSRQPCGQWRFISALPETRPVEVATVGWLLRSDAEVKVVCQSVGDLHNPANAQASGIMTIPTRCILSVERLTEEADASITSDSGSSSADRPTSDADWMSQRGRSDLMTA
jgi:hypothetical protein